MTIFPGVVDRREHAAVSSYHMSSRWTLDNDRICTAYHRCACIYERSVRGLCERLVANVAFERLCARVYALVDLQVATRLRTISGNGRICTAARHYVCVCVRLAGRRQQRISHTAGTGSAFRRYASDNVV